MAHAAGERRSFRAGERRRGSLLLITALLLCGGAVVECSPEPQRRAGAVAVGRVFRLCSRSDPALDQCLVDSLNGARAQLAEGVPELGLPPLRALPARAIVIDEGPGDFNLRFSMRGATWTGIDAFTVTRARVDLSRPYIEFHTTMPKTFLTGPYVFGGRLLTFRINGEGTGDVEFGGLNVTHRIDLKEEKRDGKAYWTVTQYIWDMDMDTVKVNFRNLFGGNRRLGSYANQLINEHWRPMYGVYRPSAVKAFGMPLQDYANALLDKVPLDQLLLP